MAIIRKIYAFLIDTVQTFLLAASVFLVIYIFLFRPFEVDGLSMFPTFHNGDYVLTNLITLKLGNIKRGDVVVFVAPPDHQKDFIKRIIGLPGDTIMLKNGNVYLNNHRLNESRYLGPNVKTYGETFLEDGQTITVPPNEYFVMGDNRPYSSDSRDWGFVKRSELIGESFFVYWPLNRIRLIANP
ncbi:MAG: signal peptidase I [Patescibacteria group bacterium]|nr:signal peptidase I [Patescibacteria group bacterium]